MDKMEGVCKLLNKTKNDIGQNKVFNFDNFIDFRAKYINKYNNVLEIIAILSIISTKTHDLLKQQVLNIYCLFC